MEIGRQGIIKVVFVWRRDVKRLLETISSVVTVLGVSFCMRSTPRRRRKCDACIVYFPRVRSVPLFFGLLGAIPTSRGSCGSNGISICTHWGAGLADLWPLKESNFYFLKSTSPQVHKSRAQFVLVKMGWEPFGPGLVGIELTSPQVPGSICIGNTGLGAFWARTCWD